MKEGVGAEFVLDFEEAARRKVLPGHWAYMASGVDDDVTLRANRDGYSHIQLRPRRLQGRASALSRHYISHRPLHARLRT